MFWELRPVTSNNFRREDGLTNSSNFLKNSIRHLARFVTDVSVNEGRQGMKMNLMLRQLYFSISVLKYANGHDNENSKFIKRLGRGIVHATKHFGSNIFAIAGV